MNAKLESYLKSLPRLLVVKTDEEARLIEEIHRSIGKNDELHVWNPAFGMMDSASYIDEWNHLHHPMDSGTAQINAALIEMYKTPAFGDGASAYFVVLDADRYMADPLVQRRLKNIAISSSLNDHATRSVILVSQTGRIPPALEPFALLHDFDNPSDELIRSLLVAVESEIKVYNENFTIPSDRVGNEIPMEFIENCRGLTAFQIKETVVHFAASQALNVTIENIKEYRKGVIEKTSLLDLLETDITFDDIAGLECLKEHLYEVRSAWTPEGKEYGVPVSRGLLQVGVPGCGKSLIAKALANEMGVTFVKFDPSNLFSSRVGDSERNMRSALTYIEAVAPCVVFIDEIEKGLAGIQSSSYSDSGTTARVIGTFLSWFQDHDDDVFIIATANGVDALPPELISRFEEKYFVGLPAQQARRACFQIQFKKYWKATMGSMDDLNFDEMAEASEYLTGREIEQVVCYAIRKAFMSEDRKLTTELTLEVIKDKPPLIQTMREEIVELLEWVGFDPERQEGVRAKYASKEDLVEADVGDNQNSSVNSVGRMGALFGQKDTETGNLN